MNLPLPAGVLAVALAALSSAPVAAAAPAVTPYNRYTLAGSTTLGTAKVNYRSSLLLPRKLNDRTANGGPVLRFGPIGSCRFNMSISATVSARSATETATAHAARLQPGTGPNVYARGTRNTAAWRVVRLKGTANVRAIWVLPVNLKTTHLIGGPTNPAWYELRGTANEHSDFACHAGGPRSIGAIFGDAFGATSGTAFATDLPRTTGPPPPVT